MKKIAVFGAGGFGREVHMLIEQINKTSPQWEFTGFFDDDAGKHNKRINNQPVLGGLDAVNSIKEELNLVFAIGNPKVKRSLVKRISNPLIKFPVLIHPNVLLGSPEFLEIGEGTIICASNIITTNIKIGRHVILNLACTVGHDTVIEDYCSFMPTVNVSGEVLIREGVFVGTGAKIINQLEVGANSVIGAGAVVAKNIPADCTAVGVPAKPIKASGN